MIMIEDISREDYRVDYDNVNDTGKPNLNRIIAHAKCRFEQRFYEQFQGSYPQAISTFSYLANQELSEREIFEMVDWFYGSVAERVVHSFALMRRLVDSYRTFREQHKRNRRAGEDWYSYCCRRREKSVQRNQHTDTLDELIYKIAKNKPKGAF